MRRAGRSSSWLALVYVLYALVACALLSVNMPPFQNPDELSHFLRADNISRGALLGQRYGSATSGGVASPGIIRAAAPFEALRLRTDARVTAGIYEAARAGWDEPGVLIPFGNTAVYPPYFYLPSVAAIWLGKAAGMGVLGTLYLARILTGLACCAGIGSALLICCRAGLTGAALLIFALALLPMSLSLQDACSQDGMMLAATALAAAWFARLRVRPAQGGFVPMCLCIVLVVAARPPYVGLALVPLACPGPWRARLVGAGLIVLTCAAWTEVNSAYVSVLALPEQKARIAAQFRDLLDPARAIALTTATVRAYGLAYATHFIGYLGSLDVPLPRALILAECSLLILVVLACAGRPSREGAVLIVAAFLSTAAIFVVQYLTWTAPGTPTVERVQGRYFLPLALMLAGMGGSLSRGPVGAGASLAAVSMPIAAIGVAVRAVVVRYYLGP